MLEDSLELQICRPLNLFERAYRPTKSIRGGSLANLFGSGKKLTRAVLLGHTRSRLLKGWYRYATLQNLKKPAMAPKQQKRGSEIYWTTITYRSVFLAVIAAIVVALFVWKIVHPSSFDSVVKAITDTIAGDTGPAPVVSNEARFVNLDGRVQVRKIGALQFTTADYQMTLAKGDVIQTGGDGRARISFANGTTYTVQPDTLITVESNNLGGTATAAQPSVTIKSGAVDLTTSSSAAEVAFEEAVAQVNPNSKAAVRTDPDSKQHEITLQAGSAELRRGGERIAIVQFDKVSFETGGSVSKSKILAPPELVAPLNLQPMVVDNAKQYPVKFEWKAVPEAVEYHLRIAASSSFSQIVAERKVATTSATISGLPAGDYFWVVTARDAKKGESQSSEVRKFLLAEKTKGQEMLLELEKPIIHGTVVEINGRTEPGAVLIINGQPVPKIEPDGKFKYFTPPMARGAQRIVISGQNRRGGTAQKELSIVIP